MKDQALLIGFYVHWERALGVRKKLAAPSPPGSGPPRVLPGQQPPSSLATLQPALQLPCTLFHLCYFFTCSRPSPSSWSGPHLLEARSLILNCCTFQSALCDLLLLPGLLPALQPATVLTCHSTARSAAPLSLADLCYVFTCSRRTLHPGRILSSWRLTASSLAGCTLRPVISARASF